MSAKRRSNAYKATAIVPLALLSAAWTASLTTGVETVAATSQATADELPDGTTLPSAAIDAPASLSMPPTASPPQADLVTPARADQIVSTSSASSIPAAALAAYQRAETVIDSADASCHLTWQLLAAIGRVESDHGRFAGSHLDDLGIASPHILGPVLDGSGGTSVVIDTDGGRLDGDPTFDRAVGPMQFIPSTWALVGVDADGDGQRNPQDINDAALAGAVYLCSGSDDLSTEAGQRVAVYRYNHSERYVDLVLSIAQSYADGDYVSTPNSAVAAGILQPEPAREPAHHQTRHHVAAEPGDQPGWPAVDRSRADPTDRRAHEQAVPERSRHQASAAPPAPANAPEHVDRPDRRGADGGPGAPAVHG